jgi:hypothetical protein
MRQNLEFFTIVSRNYLAQAFVLGDSAKKYHPDSDFIIFLMDDTKHEFEQVIQQCGFSVLYPEHVAIKDYKKLVFKYSIVEACTAVKPSVMLHLLERGADKVIYLDPDIMCFRPLREVIDALDRNAIVITPHSLSPKTNDAVLSDNLFLIYGAYNLGFLGLSSGAEAQELLRWWEKMLSRDCIIDTLSGLFVDQKWFDLVPAYFEGVYVLRSLVYNIAYWNIHERTLCRDGDNYKVVQSGEPVAFVHFSRVDVHEPGRISKYIPAMSDYANKSDLVDIFALYAKKLQLKGYERYSKIPYAYSTFANGEMISVLERQLYLAYFDEFMGDPFLVGERTFWKFCRELRISTGDIPSKIGPVCFGGKRSISGDEKKYGRRLLAKLVETSLAIGGIRNTRRVISFLNQQAKCAEHDLITTKAKEYKFY